MNFKELSKVGESFKIGDASKSKKLYGATLEQWDDAGAMDEGGIGFDTYPFTPEGLGKMGKSMYEDSMSAFRKPAQVEEWESVNDIETKALEFLKNEGIEDPEYTIYGGVVVYFDNDNECKFEVLTKVLDAKSQSKDLTEDGDLGKFISALKEKLKNEGISETKIEEIIQFSIKKIK